MSKITLITGGARSGKSSYAENLLDGNDDVLYIATAIRTDKEMEARIEHHIQSRNPKWETSEGYRDLGEVIRETDKSFILLDCVTNMISNLLFALDQDLANASQATLDELYQSILKEFQELIEAARSYNKTLILVSNEVGMGLISEYKLGRVFVDFAGWINQWLAQQADEVTFMVSGLPLHLKLNPIKKDQAKQDPLRREPEKQGTTKQDSRKQESKQKEPTQIDPLTQQALEREPFKQVAINQGPVKRETIQPESGMLESIKQNPSEDI